jgi:transcriptional regulator with XRE-family HTH domain
LAQFRTDWEWIPACCRRSSDIDTRVGTRIRARRERLGMSHDDLARVVHISRRTLRSYETGTVRSLPADLCAIAATLGVSLSYLFEEECLGSGSI